MARTFETPKGTRDFLPEEMRIRNAVFERLRRAFLAVWFDELDTPAFEYLALTPVGTGCRARNLFGLPTKAIGGWSALRP